MGCLQSRRRRRHQQQTIGIQLRLLTLSMIRICVSGLISAVVLVKTSLSRTGLGITLLLLTPFKPKSLLKMSMAAIAVHQRGVSQMLVMLKQREASRMLVRAVPLIRSLLRGEQRVQRFLLLISHQAPPPALTTQVRQITYLRVMKVFIVQRRKSMMQRLPTTLT